VPERRPDEALAPSARDPVPSPARAGPYYDFAFRPVRRTLPHLSQDSPVVNAEAAPIEWFPLLVIAASAMVMVFLARRAMRGMNQQDWILLRQARARGIDLSQPQPVSFVVFAATEAVGSELAETMRREGYETAMKQAQIQFARNRRKPGAPQDGWLVSGTRSVLLAPETLKDIRKTLTALAAERKALYLGWQLAGAVVPFNSTAPAGDGGGQAPAPERQRP
jgi:hypothetical protein